MDRCEPCGRLVACVQCCAEYIGDLWRLKEDARDSLLPQDLRANSNHGWGCRLFWTHNIRPFLDPAFRALATL